MRKLKLIILIVLMIAVSPAAVFMMMFVNALCSWVPDSSILYAIPIVACLPLARWINSRLHVVEELRMFKTWQIFACTAAACAVAGLVMGQIEFTKGYVESLNLGLAFVFIYLILVPAIFFGLRTLPPVRVGALFLLCICIATFGPFKNQKSFSEDGTNWKYNGIGVRIVPEILGLHNEICDLSSLPASASGWVKIDLELQNEDGKTKTVQVMYIPDAKPMSMVLLARPQSTDPTYGFSKITNFETEKDVNLFFHSAASPNCFLEKVIKTFSQSQRSYSQRWVYDHDWIQIYNQQGQFVNKERRPGCTH